MPYVLTTPQGHRAGAITAKGVVRDAQTGQFTRFDYTLVDMDDEPLLEIGRSGDLRHSDSCICKPGSDEVLARVTMQLGQGRRLYEVYDDRGAPSCASQPFVFAEVRSSEDQYVFKNATGEVIAGAENMYKYYSYVRIC